MAASLSGSYLLPGCACCVRPRARRLAHRLQGGCKSNRERNDCAHCFVMYNYGCFFLSSFNLSLHSFLSSFFSSLVSFFSFADPLIAFLRPLLQPHDLYTFLVGIAAMVGVFQARMAASRLRRGPLLTSSSLRMMVRFLWLLLQVRERERQKKRDRKREIERERQKERHTQRGREKAREKEKERKRGKREAFPVVFAFTLSISLIPPIRRRRVRCWAWWCCPC